MYLITSSLLSSWLYQWADFEKYGAQAEEFRLKAAESFALALRREEIPATEAMRRGIDFENMARAIAEGGGDTVKDSAWFAAAAETADVLRGGLWQYKASKEASIAGEGFLLYGRLDALKAGVIYDIQFTGGYEAGKYFNSPQHSVYMELVPEARKFVYLISDGCRVWRETYERGEIKPVSDIVSQFVMYLKENGLFDVYTDKWKTRYGAEWRVSDEKAAWV
jgi:hypothetical protein